MDSSVASILGDTLTSKGIFTRSNCVLECDRNVKFLLMFAAVLQKLMVYPFSAISQSQTQSLSVGEAQQVKYKPELG